MDNIDRAAAIAMSSGRAQKLVTRAALDDGETVWPEANERVLDASEPHGSCETIVATVEPYVHPRDTTLRTRIRYHRQSESSMMLLA